MPTIDFTEYEYFTPAQERMLKLLHDLDAGPDDDWWMVIQGGQVSTARSLEHRQFTDYYVLEDGKHGVRLTRRGRRLIEQGVDRKIQKLMD